MGEGWEQPLSLREATRLSELTDAIHNAKLSLQQRHKGGHRLQSPKDAEQQSLIPEQSLGALGE